MVRSVAVAVRVQPGAARPRVGGRHEGPYGPALVVAVSAPAVDGRASEACRHAVAAALGLRPRAVSLRSAAASRDKLFDVELPADLTDEVLLDRLGRLRDGSPS
jgi:uncharacterized protein YggU (UPF0235/DUF167 family)